MQKPAGACQKKRKRSHDDEHVKVKPPTKKARSVEPQAGAKAVAAGVVQVKVKPPSDKAKPAKQQAKAKSDSAGMRQSTQAAKSIQHQLPQPLIIATIYHSSHFHFQRVNASLLIRGLNRIIRVFIISQMPGGLKNSSSRNVNWVLRIAMMPVPPSLGGRITSSTLG